MKRWICPLLALVLMFACGCSESQAFLSVTPHEEQYVTEENADALVVNHYEGMVDALLQLIRNVEPSGLIRAYNYEGEVTTDIARAVYEAAKQTVLGSYAVDYITYDCAQVVSYYEIAVRITYTRTPQELQSLITTRGQNAVKSRIAGALESYTPERNLYLHSYEPFDLEAYVHDYYMANPAKVQALPAVQWHFYPKEDEECILLLEFSYPHPEETMRQYQTEVQDVTAAAIEYVQYRENESEKIQLLYSYLSERFEYTERSSETPVYSVLCEGIADSFGFARAMQVLCDALQIECRTVSGSKEDAEWYWNIVSLDGRYYHIDVMHAVSAALTMLPLNLDSAMGAYSWNPALYPACEAVADSWIDVPDGNFEGNIIPGT